MHRAKEKVIPIAGSDDKCQITAVFAATLTGEYLPPQVIYKGKPSDAIQKYQFLRDGMFGTVKITDLMKRQ